MGDAIVLSVVVVERISDYNYFKQQYVTAKSDYDYLSLIVMEDWWM
jgi:hypothetical protein